MERGITVAVSLNDKGEVGLSLTCDFSGVPLNVMAAAWGRLLKGVRDGISETSNALARECGEDMGKAFSRSVEAVSRVAPDEGSVRAECRFERDRR